MQMIVNGGTVQPGEGILKSAEGIDIMPSNIRLCATEIGLVDSGAQFKRYEIKRSFGTTDWRK